MSSSVEVHFSIYICSWLINVCALIATSDDKMDDWCFIAGKLQLLSCSGPSEGCKQEEEPRDPSISQLQQFRSRIPRLLQELYVFVLK